MLFSDMSTLYYAVFTKTIRKNFCTITYLQYIIVQEVSQIYFFHCFAAIRLMFEQSSYTFIEPPTALNYSLQTLPKGPEQTEKHHYVFFGYCEVNESITHATEDEDYIVYAEIVDVSPRIFQNGISATFTIFPDDLSESAETFCIVGCFYDEFSNDSCDHCCFTAEVVIVDAECK